MQDISELSQSDKAEIADYIKRDNLDAVNKNLQAVHIKNSFYTRYGKRMLDIILSFFAVMITLPINLVLAVITFFDVGRPLIFKQSRVGKDEKIFTIYKFRNMTNERDTNGELLPPSQRITKWGKIVRKTSLDELLNFICVLNGSMSIIGPRPLLDYYAERMNVRHKMIYAVRPGLECPTLKGGHYLLSWQERLDNYVWYVENCSLFVDIRLAFRVVQMAFNRKSTVQRSNADHGGFMGYDQDGNIIYTKSVPDKYVTEFCLKHGFSDFKEAIVNRKCNIDKQEKITV